MKKEISRKFCVAPMMGYTTPYARKLYRILSKKVFLFTEMIASKSLIYSKNGDFKFDMLRKISLFPKRYHFNNFTNVQHQAPYSQDVQRVNMYKTGMSGLTVGRVSKVSLSTTGSAAGIFAFTAEF